MTDLTIYGNMTSYMIQNRNFELNAMVTVTCDGSNHIRKYLQFTSKMTFKVLQQCKFPSLASPTSITQFTHISTMVSWLLVHARYLFWLWCLKSFALLNGEWIIIVINTHWFLTYMNMKEELVPAMRKQWPTPTKWEWVLTHPLYSSYSVYHVNTSMHSPRLLRAPPCHQMMYPQALNRFLPTLYLPLHY